VKDFVPILNYSSADLDILRPDLLFSNLDTVRFNLNHKNKDLKLFEFGKSYRKSTEGYKEFENLAITLVGKQEVERWNAHHQDVDYYTLKGYIHQMMTKLGVQRYLVEELNDQAYLFGLSYIIKGREDKELVKFGRIEPSVAKAFGVDQPVYYANFNWKVALDVALNQKMKFKGIAKYPATRRDLALLIDKGISFSQIENIASKVDKRILKAIDLFDVFEGDQLPEGKKSYAVSFVFQDENKTLTDKEVDKVMNQLIDRCQKDLNAQLR
jgi:phenylalanyl-tRNA synthetase beta chain